MEIEYTSEISIFDFLTNFREDLRINLNKFSCCDLYIREMIKLDAYVVSQINLETEEKKKKIDEEAEKKLKGVQKSDKSSL